MTLHGRKTLEMILALWGIATLVFLAFSVIPLDPARALLGPNASQSAVDSLNAEFGLDRPLPLRYLRSMQRFAHGDFGRSFYFRRPATAVVCQLAPITLARTMGALGVGVTCGLFFAWAMSLVDQQVWARRVLLALQSIPSFCFALIALWASSRWIGTTPIRAPLLFELATAIVSSFYTFGAVGSFVLERMAPSWGTPKHIEFLQLLGAPRSYIDYVKLKDAVPGALAISINAVTVALTAVSFCELIFNLKGFGVVFIRSCERGDYSVAMAGSVLLCAFIILIQGLGDAAMYHYDSRFRKI